MNRYLHFLYGTMLTIFIYGAGILAPYIIKIDAPYFPKSMVTHGTMLILSVVAIILLSKYDFFKFEFKKVKFKHYLYGFLVAIIGFLIANIIATIFLLVFGYPIMPGGKGHPLLEMYNPLQIFLFIFIFASISEEFLFRGVAQNFFQPFKSIGIKINKNVTISLPVILSGLFFGLAHLVLLQAGTSGTVVFRIVIMTFFIGTIAGFFQEKHQSILPAIVVHMTANLPGLIISLLT